MELFPTPSIVFFFSGVVLILGSYFRLKRGRISWQKNGIYLQSKCTHTRLQFQTSRDGAIFSTQRLSRKIKLPEVLGTWHSTGRKTDRGRALVQRRGSNEENSSNGWTYGSSLPGAGIRTYDVSGG